MLTHDITHAPHHCTYTQHTTITMEEEGRNKGKEEGKKKERDEQREKGREERKRGRKGSGRKDTCACGGLSPIHS